MTTDDPNRRSFLEAASACGLSASALAMGLAAPNGASAAPDESRELSPAAADLGSLYADVIRLGRAEFPLSYLSGRYSSLDDFKKTGREKIVACHGRLPEKVELKPEIVHREDAGEFIREKVLFSTAPDIRVPAYVHIPKGLTGRAPAIVDLHSHGGMFLFGKEKVIDFGEKNHAVMTGYHERNYGGRPTATALVRRGYVVITIDALMFGERRAIMDEDLKFGWDRAKYSVETADQLNRKCRAKESTIAKSLAYLGMTWPGVVTWDDMRSVDYLLTRPEVDPARIGCVGVSMGGWRSLFLSALDERIAAACIVGFMSTVAPMVRRHIDTHSFVHFVPGLHQFLDLPDVASIMAPKPLMVQQCREDGLFPPAGMTASVEKIAAAYEKAGVKDRFRGRCFPGGHRFDVAMQDEAFAWFDGVLKR